MTAAGLRDVANRYLSPAVPLIYRGEKIVDGRRTGEPSITFGVVEKRPSSQVWGDASLPTSIGSAVTDVVEVGHITARELTDRRRPCPPGYSVGHGRISAGTLGLWIRRLGSDLPHILSNNHVLANSNEAQQGDVILQPGRFDDGTEELARLAEWVQIGFEGFPGKKKLGLSLWRAVKWLPNLIARFVGCPNRLVLSTRAVPQPYPNLVDAAIAVAAVADADLQFPLGLGRPQGTVELALGQDVLKVGRTTELTRGTVVGLRGEALVDYGGGRIARFSDQIVIGPGAFSAPGDSGSAIMSNEMRWGGLLFAGSDTITLACQAATIMALLGVTLEV